MSKKPKYYIFPTVNDIRAEYKLDILKEDEIQLLQTLENLISTAAENDKDCITYTISFEEYSKYFVPNTRVGNTLLDAGYRLDITNPKDNKEADLIISFCRVKI